MGKRGASGSGCAPRTTSVAEWPGMSIGAPLESKRPRRGPTMMQPMRPVRPPTMCTTPEPARRRGRRRRRKASGRNARGESYVNSSQRRHPLAHTCKIYHAAAQQAVLVEGRQPAPGRPDPVHNDGVWAWGGRGVCIDDGGVHGAWRRASPRHALVRSALCGYFQPPPRGCDHTQDNNRSHIQADTSTWGKEGAPRRRWSGGRDGAFRAARGAADGAAQHPAHFPLSQRLTV